MVTHTPASASYTGCTEPTAHLPTCVVEWFIIVRTGVISMCPPASVSPDCMRSGGRSAVDENKEARRAQGAGTVDGAAEIEKESQRAGERERRATATEQREQGASERARGERASERQSDRATERERERERERQRQTEQHRRRDRETARSEPGRDRDRETA